MALLYVTLSDPINNNNNNNNIVIVSTKNYGYNSGHSPRQTTKRLERMADFIVMFELSG